MKLTISRSYTRFLKFLALCIPIVTLFLPVSVTHAQESAIIPPDISITQAINIALANNTQMKRALLSVKDAEQQVREAWSNVMPNIAASANYTRNLEVPVNFIPAIIFDPSADPETLTPVAFGTDNSWTGGFSATQTLFSGQAFVGISAADIYMTAQNEVLRATSQQVVTQTRIQYYQVLVNLEQLKLIEAQIGRIQKNLEDSKKLLLEGYSDEYAVLQLEVQLANLLPQRTNATFTIKSAKRNLLDVIGLPLDLPFNVTGNLSSFDVYADEVSDSENSELKEVDRRTTFRANKDSLTLKEAFVQRGDMRVLDVQAQLQEKNLISQRTAYLPTITANYGLNWSASQAGTPVFFGTEESRARSQILGVNVDVPIFQGFRRDATIQKTKIQLKDLELQTNQTKRLATKEVMSAQESIQEVFLTLDARQKALEQATLGYERALARNKAGVGSQQEITDADLQLRQAEVNQAQTVFRYLTAKAQYDQAIGAVPFVDDFETIENNIDL
jgi:outer membrane protein TolC